jgi:hypothetical protein
MYTAIPRVEARDFYPLLGEVGKDVMEEEARLLRLSVSRSGGALTPVSSGAIL